MRSSPFIGPILALIAPLTALCQQPGPATVTVNEVTVYAGASEIFPVSGKLARNDTVMIKAVVNYGAWLEIAPPAGSFSWVRDEDVQPGPTEGVKATLIVSVKETDLRAGELNNPQPSRKVSAKLRKSTKLIVRGEKVLVAIDKKHWWPVECVAEESRFIPVSAVQKSVAAGESSPMAPSGAKASQESAQWRLAEQAQREGRLDDAERLFADIARENAPAGKDFELAIRANNRIREIRRQRAMQLTSRPRDGSPYIPPTGVPTFTPPADLMPPRPSLPLPGSAMNRNPSGIATGNGRWESTGEGWLRRSGFQIDRKQTYALESSNGQLRVYVTADPGVDLEAHLNRRVELWGTFEVRGDVRGASYMRVARVVPLR